MCLRKRHCKKRHRNKRHRIKRHRIKRHRIKRHRKKRHPYLKIVKDAIVNKKNHQNHSFKLLYQITLTF